MEVKNTDSMSVTDNLVEKYVLGEISYRAMMNELWPQVCEETDRIWKLLNTGYHYYEHDPLLESWLKQWHEKPEYNIYNAKDVTLFVKNNMLFLIPLEDGKPIKVIIA